MGEGFIVRRGGGGQQTVKPIYNSLTEVGFTSLTLSVTNDSNSIATLYYSVVNNEPGPDQVGTFDTEFAGKETKDITITGLTSGTTYTVYIKAAAVGEFPSETITVSDLTTGQAISATGGTTLEYDSGGKRYRSHTFTSNGTFQVTQLSNMGSTFNQVDYLIIAGGGGGAGGIGGGGGAGGYRTTNGTSGRNSSAEPKITVTNQSYSVTIGNGGSGNFSATGTVNSGGNGGDSSFANIVALGGGGGRGGEGQTTGNNGGSGGGIGYGNNVSGVHGTATAGTTGQGFGGGRVRYASGSGGGGAGQVGFDSWQSLNQTDSGGYGGNGLANILRTGSNETRAGGGGGGARDYNSQRQGLGGAGGGGNGSGRNAANSNILSTPGAINSGGGGGGGVYQTTNNLNRGSNGGSGIVVIRYEIAPSV
jgi:hypothetical protein